MASTLHWDPDKMLQLYILDYMKRRGMDKTAEIFQTESDVMNAPVVIQSREGFLHEWWSVFYDIYASRHLKHQEIGPEASSNALQNTSNGRRNLPPRIPQLSKQRTQLLQLDPAINKMMEQPATFALPPKYEREYLGYLAGDSNPNLQLISAKRLKFLEDHPQLDIGIQAHNPLLKDSGIGIQQGGNIPMDSLGKVQRGTTEGLNLVPLNGYPLNVGAGLYTVEPFEEESHNVLTSLLQAPNYQQQFQGLDTQNQKALACTPKIQASICLENSSVCNSQDPRIPLVETEICKDRQDCINAAVGRPVDKNIVPLSDENEHADQRSGPSRNLKLIFAACDMREGFSFEEVGCLHSSKSEVLSCHFSSDGKVLASAGHEKKVFVWNMETFDCVSTSDAHSLLITDIRFRPGSTIFATSSADKTVKVWDAAKPNKSLFELPGHAEQVMSLDFHPRKVDLLCSSDSNGIMRLWNVTQGVCVRINKGGSKQVRFQPRIANFLAAAAGNIINVIDLEGDKLIHKLKGHVKDVISICWDVTGNYLASVSEDSARVWSVTSDGKCIQVLHSNGNKFQSCIFHPVYYNLLIIGCNQSLEFWIPTEGCKIWTHPAHKEVIAGLGASPENQMVASASHDHTVKLWK
ncbi:transcriptional corepressor LEUNIG-like isoform X2 [Prosopis cineraria]|uniref:transcriptional corepressor LEUNIG-like isoform X2 n=1 Tax=Prosopis cineraria TaxID=364024 RepID=UPI002410B0EF|nr:transcriptional corepressor LEUNIG-like isoform X2 [Prosopis cineraria]